MSTFELSHEMRVSAPAEAVFAFLSNSDHFVELVSSMVELRGHAGPLSADATWQTVSRFMGRQVVADNRVLEFDPPRRFRYETRSAAANGVSLWEVEPVAGGTQVRHKATGDATGFFGSLAMGLIRRNVEQQFKADMARLERRLNALG